MTDRKPQPFRVQLRLRDGGWCIDGDLGLGAEVLCASRFGLFFEAGDASRIEIVVRPGHSRDRWPLRVRLVTIADVQVQYLSGKWTEAALLFELSDLLERHGYAPGDELHVECWTLE